MVGLSHQVAQLVNLNDILEIRGKIKLREIHIARQGASGPRMVFHVR